MSLNFLNERLNNSMLSVTMFTSGALKTKRLLKQNLLNMVQKNVYKEGHVKMYYH